MRGKHLYYNTYFILRIATENDNNINTVLFKLYIYKNIIFYNIIIMLLCISNII